MLLVIWSTNTALHSLSSSRPTLSCFTALGHSRYKAYLDDFAAYCTQLGGTTAEVMTDLLAFEVREAGMARTAKAWGNCRLAVLC